METDPPGEDSHSDELWSAAVEVARRDGVNRTAAADSRLRKAPPAFVELMASGAAGLAEYMLELEGRNGKLRIQCKGAAAADLAELSRTLWGLAA